MLINKIKRIIDTEVVPDLGVVERLTWNVLE